MNMFTFSRQMVWMKAISLVISALATLWILFTFWTWLTPATFWQKVAGLLLSLAGGIMLFAFFQFLLMLIIGLIFAKYIQRKFMQGFAREEGEHEESMYR